MQEINFEKVGMKNFGPYIDPLEFEIGENNLILITGPNGVGKTMSLDAIPYTLYGLTSKGAKGDDVVNNIVEKNCHTWLHFRVGNDEYKLNRYHKYTRLGNTVILSRNGVEIKKGQKEVLPEIERLIRPRKLFMNTLMFGQKIKDFFTDLPDSEKKEIFRKVLPLDEYQGYYDKAKSVLDALIIEVVNLHTQIEVNRGLQTEMISQISEQEKKKIEFTTDKIDDIRELRNQIESQERHLNDWEDILYHHSQERLQGDKIKDAISEIQQALNVLEDTHKNLLELVEHQRSAKYAELRAQAEATKSDISKKHRELIDELTNKRKQEVDRYNSENNKVLEDERKLKTSLNSILNASEYERAAMDELQEFLASDYPTCPTCRQDIDLNGIDNLKAKIEECNEKIKSYFIEGDDITSKLQFIKDTLASLFDRHDIETSLINKETKKLLGEEEKELDATEEKLQELFKQVDFVANGKKQEFDTKNKEETAELIKKLASLEEGKSKYEVREMVMDREEESYRNDSSENKITKALLKQTEQEKFDETDLYKLVQKEYILSQKNEILTQDIQILERQKTIVEFWKQAYSSTGIPSMLIDDAIPFMNERVAYYLEKISNGRYIVSFDTLSETKSGEFRDKISVNVLDTKTRADRRVQFSGGQTRVVDIAIILTLGDLQAKIQDIKFNILLFDEIFDSLDDENIGYVSKVLRVLANKKTIFIISHRHVDQLEADEVFQLN